ncbi:hypothetical protein [Streptomyces sp. NPDC002851]
MWPGQQPPGGEQNPQDPNQNPYQKPGYQQQPNPYQQPGYPQQPTPHPQTGQQPGQPGQQPGQPPAQAGPPGQPPVPPGPPGQPPTQPGQPLVQPGQLGQPPVNPQWNAPTVPVGSPNGPGDDRRKTTIIAVAAATAVVVAAGVTGFLVLGGDKDDESKGGDAKPSNSASSSAAPADPTPTDNPRAGDSEGDVKPVVKGWSVVVNPKRGAAFDVPKDWTISDPSRSIGYEDVKTKQPVTSMTGVAEYKEDWCEYDENKDGRTDDWSLAAAGIKGANGAKNTGEAAQNTVGWWIYGPYTQPNQKNIKLSKPSSFTTDSGLKGSIAYAESNGVKKQHKCHTEGKAVSFAFKNSVNDYAVFTLFGPKDVKDELSNDTIKKILKSIRLSGDPIQD